MIITKLDDGRVEIGLQPAEVESAIRQFICTCHPKIAYGFVIDPSPDQVSRLPEISFIAKPFVAKP